MWRRPQTRLHLNANVSIAVTMQLLLVPVQLGIYAYISTY